MSGAANRLDGRFWFDGTPFKAEENVGTGAYGVVCKARDTINNTKVAIKKIPRAFAADTIAKRTLREIRILRNLLHENIISVIDMFTAQGVLGKDIYLVMDLMETDLHQILHSRQNLEEQHFQYFLYQLLRGLKYLHSAGIIHRDLKPSNLLLNSDCLLRIADFGMARFIGEPSSSERIDDIKDGSLTQYVSTRWYRAPEILFSLDDYDTKADIWSAGCIFGEMLLRRQLFPGRDGVSQVKMLIYFLGTPDDQLMEKIQSDTIKEWIISCNKKDSLPFSAIFPKASEQARDMISKMLQISPWKRSTASQILEHPFLSLYHNEEYEPLCSSRVKTDISAIENYQGDAILENLFEEERIFEKKRGRKYTTRKSPPPKISEDCEQSIIIDKEGHGPRCDPTDHFGIKNFAEDQKSCYSNSSTETIGTVRHLSSTSQKEGEQFINQRKPNIFSNGINWPLDEACSSSAPPILNKGANYPRDRNHRRIIEKKVADRIRDECIERRIPKLREKRSNSDSSSIEDKETYAHAKMKRSRQDLRQCTQDDERRTNKIAL